MALLMVKTLTAQGAVYQSIEITGDAIRKLSMDGRFTIANLVTEIGGKNCIMEYDGETERYIRQISKKNQKIQPVFPDRDASYLKEVVLNINDLTPLLQNHIQLIMFALLKRLKEQKSIRHLLEHVQTEELRILQLPQRYLKVKRFIVI